MFSIEFFRFMRPRTWLSGNSDRIRHKIKSKKKGKQISSLIIFLLLLQFLKQYDCLLRYFRGVPPNPCCPLATSSTG